MFVFAGIFALLAWRPLSLPGVFELAIAHKLAMTVVAVSAGSAVGAAAAAIGDGALTVVLIAAYVLCRAWRAWSLPESRRTQDPDAGRIVARARSAECGVQPGGDAVRLYGQRTGKGTAMSPPQRNSTARLGVGVTAALVLLVAVIELAKATV